MKLVLLGCLAALALISGRAAEPRVYEVPMQLSDYRLLYVKVTLEGHECLASIDTGSFRSVEVSSTLARELNLSLEKTNQVARRINGKEFYLQKGHVDSLKIGDWSGRDVAIDVAEGDIEAIAQQVGVKFEMILGWGFLGQFPLQVDYRAKTLRWGAPFAAAKDALIIPFEVKNRVPTVAGKIDGREVRLLFDTGAPMCNLDPEYAGDAKVGTKRPTALQLGGKDFALDFRVKPLSFKQSLGCVAVVGNNLLSEYVVTFDPTKREIRLTRP